MLFHACALTVKLRGRAEAPDGAEGAQFPSARGAKPQAHHGPLQRLLEVALELAGDNIIAAVLTLSRNPKRVREGPRSQEAVAAVGTPSDAVIEARARDEARRNHSYPDDNNGSSANRTEGKQARREVKDICNDANKSERYQPGKVCD